MAIENTEESSVPIKRCTINACLEHHSEERPSKPYIIYGNEEREVSYEEMNERANAIGRNLREFGCRVEQRTISVMMKGQLPTLFTLHGILKAAGIFAPIHTDYKGENLSHQLNDCETEILVIDDRYVDRINVLADELDHLQIVVVRDTGAESVKLDDAFEHRIFSEMLHGLTTKPDVDISWDDTATVIYTSGTTGMPKGVLHSHRQILVMFSETKAIFISEDDVVHNNLPLFHVGGLYGNILAALIAGATVVCWDKFRTGKFWDRVEKYEASRAVIFSSMITWLNDQPETETDHHNTLNKVTLVPLVDEYEEIANRFGFDIVDTYYGQTEIGLVLAGVVRVTSANRTTPPEFQRGRSPEKVVGLAAEKGIPVCEQSPGSNWAGKPVFPVEVAIVDERDVKLSAGEVGELVARPMEPSMIFQSYVNNPEATAKAWRNLWHHTGDALRRDENGHYYFVDRIGDVIRRHGENIATTQIEGPLTGSDGIKDVVAFPVPAVDGEEDDIAIALELEPSSNLDPDAIQDISRKLLPRFMTPGYIRIVDELPTTETAKVEKYKLREQVIAEEDLDEAEG